MRRLVISLIILATALCFSSAQAVQHKKKPKPAAKVTQPPIDPALILPQQPPPPPPTPEQGPSSPPEVTYQGGQLVILARNSTMGDVLTAVKQKTGASVEMPAVSSERVVGRFGPGAPRDVMAQLLNGSHYDYVLLGSPADPGALRKVVLMARTNGPQPNPQQQAQQRNPQGFQNPNFPNATPPENENLQAVPEVETDQDAEENSNEAPPDAQQPAEEPQPDQPGQANGPSVKTPEQLLRELQQQQQQQQQEQQPPGVPPGAPGQPPQ